MSALTKCDVCGELMGGLRARDHMVTATLTLARGGGQATTHAVDLCFRCLALVCPTVTETGAAATLMELIVKAIGVEREARAFSKGRSRSSADDGSVA